MATRNCSRQGPNACSHSSCVYCVRFDDIFAVSKCISQPTDWLVPQSMQQRYQKAHRPIKTGGYRIVSAVRRGSAAPTSSSTNLGEICQTFRRVGFGIREARSLPSLFMAKKEKASVFSILLLKAKHKHRCE